MTVIWRFCKDSGIFGSERILNASTEPHSQAASVLDTVAPEALGSFFVGVPVAVKL